MNFDCRFSLYNFRLHTNTIIKSCVKNREPLLVITNLIEEIFELDSLLIFVLIKCLRYAVVYNLQYFCLQASAFHFFIAVAMKANINWIK